MRFHSAFHLFLQGTAGTRMQQIEIALISAVGPGVRSAITAACARAFCREDAAAGGCLWRTMLAVLDDAPEPGAGART